MIKLGEGDNQRIYARDSEKELHNLGKRGKVEYFWDNFVYIGHCPMCKEITYEETHCVFCGCEFEKPTDEEIQNKREKNHEYTVTCGDITLHQIGNSIFTYKGKIFLSHSSLSKPCTKEELEEMAKKKYEAEMKRNV